MIERLAIRFVIAGAILILLTDRIWPPGGHGMFGIAIISLLLVLLSPGLTKGRFEAD